jgi:hypothetical protein
VQLHRHFRDAERAADLRAEERLAFDEGSADGNASREALLSEESAGCVRGQ